MAKKVGFWAKPIFGTKRRLNMNEMLLTNFKKQFPCFADRAVEYREKGPFELVVKLDDGHVISYYDTEQGIRRLPSDDSCLTEEECREEFGIRLYRLMYDKGVTQSELSEMTGITQSNISNYITGRKTPSFYTVDKIARALDCSIEELRYKY